MQKWNFKPTIYIGKDAFSVLEQLIKQRVFIICDPFLLNTPIFTDVVKRIENCNNVVELYADVSPDPPIEDIVKGVEAINIFKPDVLIAMGGGSAIDLAKGIKYFSERASQQIFSQFIAIPTTSGTGSEVTNISVITDKTNNIKYPLVHNSLTPDVAILNVELVMSAPDTVVSYSGLDVLTHALEALVATNSNSITDALSEKAIGLVFTHLVNSYKNKDYNSREKMHEASTIAGIAFNEAGLGINHAIAHQLGGQFHLVHGLANAILLPHVVTFNAKNKKAQEKYAEVARKIGVSDHYDDDEVAVVHLVNAIQKLMDQLNCATSLSANGVKAADAEQVIDLVAENALRDITTHTNPVAVTKDDIANVYRKIY